MSIERVDPYGGAVSLVCDDCGKGVDFPSFKAAVDFKKKERLKSGGWRSSKQGTEWKDHCSECCLSFRVLHGR